MRDNGIGIAAEHLPRVFEMFAQVDTSLERSRGGLGIGLTLVKTLVEMHGGTRRGAERRARARQRVRRPAAAGRRRPGRGRAVPPVARRTAGGAAAS